MYYVYILQSEKRGRFYIGYSKDAEKRLLLHNQGKVKATQYLIPWKMIYFEQWPTRAEALKRERYIKIQKSRRFIEKLVNTGG